MSYYNSGYQAYLDGVERDCNETDAPEWFEGWDDAEFHASSGYHGGYRARVRARSYTHRYDPYDCAHDEE